MLFNEKNKTVLSISLDGCMARGNGDVSWCSQMKIMDIADFMIQ